MKRTRFLAILLPAVLLFACKGDPGEPGPSGANGKDGNANIQSITIPISSGDWLIKPGSNSSEAVISLFVPQITEEVVSSGLVAVYMQTTDLPQFYSVNQWIALPFSVARESSSISGYSESIGFSATPGTLTLYDFTDATPLYKPGGTIRIVTATADGMVGPADWGNYYEVSDYFGLED